MSETEETSWIQLISSAVKSEQLSGMDKLKLLLQDLSNSQDPEKTEVAIYLSNSCREFNNISTPDKVTVLTVGVAFLMHSSRNVIHLFEKQFVLDLKKHSLAGLNADSPQLRNISGTYLGTLCQKLGHHTFADLKPSILELFYEFNNENKRISKSSTNIQTPPPSPSASVNEPSAQIFRDTASWKCLDTWICCMQKMATGCGPEFAQFVDLEFLSCISCSLDNRERFVRESCCVLIKIIIIHCQIFHYWQQQIQTEEQKDVTIKIKNKFIDLILKGMSDSWADVRLPACIAARELILSTKIKDEDTFDEEMLNRLLPVLCFNRYSVAIGLQRYSQETWMMMTKGQGKKKIEDNIESVVQFYQNQMIFGDSECKEMSCHCFNECIKKLEENIIRPLVGNILNTLKQANIFRDVLWSTRDAACLLTLQIVEKFKEDCVEYVDYLTEEMFVLIEDLAPTVRESSASVLAMFVKYNESSLSKMMEKIRAGLKNIHLKYKETANKPDICEHNEKETTSEPKQQQTANQIQSETTNETTVLPNTESPKIEQASSSSSSSPPSHNTDPQNRPKITFIGFPTGPSSISYSKRNVETWEVADGCICLLRKLSTTLSSPTTNQLTTLIPILAESAYIKNYNQRPFYIQTLLKQLPEIYEGLGKICLKRSIELFFDVIIEFYMSSDGSFLPTHHAAVECLDKLGQQLGKSILRERLASYDPVFVDKFIKF